MGAGILPISILRGQLYILLGLERKNGLWCDFGGSSNRGETPYRTAIREGYEETNGFFGTEKELEKLVNRNKIIKINYDKYTSYVFKINYTNTLPKYFNNLNKFVEKNLKDKNIIDSNHNGLFEKTQVKWFPLSDFKDPHNLELLRRHYIVIIKTIIENEDKIKSIM